MIFARGIDSFQAAILLFEIGATIESQTLIRCGVECIFALHALATGFPLRDRLNKAHLFARKSWVNAQARVSEVSRLDGELLSRLLASCEGVTRDEVRMLELAEQGNQSDLYNTVYKGLSHMAVHMSEGSLGGILESDSLGGRRGTIILLAQMYSRLLTASEKLHGEDALSDELVALMRRMLQLSGEPAPVL